MENNNEKNEQINKNDNEIQKDLIKNMENFTGEDEI